MRRHRSPLNLIRSALGVLLALMLLATAGLAPATAAAVRGQAVSLPLTVLQAEQTAISPFADVATSHDFYEQISWLGETGISTGWPGPEGTRLFRPYEPVLRDQMAAFLYRMAGSPAFDASATSPFADVPTTHDFYRQISWLAETGISTGWPGPDGTRLFRPYEPVLRDQMAAFLHRMAGSPAIAAPEVPPFADVSAGHDFSEQISWLAETGISTGWSGPGGTRLFRPYQPVLRDQMAAFLHRVDRLLPGRSTPTAEVVSGYNSAYAVRADGTVWSWGGNRRGQLGNGTTTDSSVPVQVPGLSDVLSLETNSSAAHALRADGTVWAWGWNYAGQLGNGTTTDSSVPVPVPGLSDVESLETNGDGVFAVRTDGTVWAWGGNRFGQLGIGTMTGTSVPVQVTGLPGVQSVRTEGVSTYALTTEGTVWAWGLNSGGQLGNGTTKHSTVPVEVSGLSGVEILEADRGGAYALTSDGTVWAWGGNGTDEPDLVPVQVTGLPDVVDLEAHNGAAYALTADGTVWSWGSNYAGQLGNGTTTDYSAPAQIDGPTGVRSIETNNVGTAYAVTTDGTVWAWGGNRFGELGNGTTTDYSSVPAQIEGLPDVESLESINHFAYAVTTDGKVWAWGWNHVGQLGNGTTTDSSVPIPVSRING